MHTERIKPLIYTEGNDDGCIQEECNPTRIQGERSDIYTERAKLGFKRIDNRLIFRDNNGSMPPVMGTGKSY